MKEIYNTLISKWTTSYKLNSIRTNLFKFLPMKSNSKIIFIFGCQRSGTTMTGKVLGYSPFVNAYGEGDLPYFNQKDEPNHLRLVDSKTIKKLIEKEKSKFTLLKPLYDSQIASNLLCLFPNSKGIWIFRHYLDVVDSHIKYYKNSHDGISYSKDLFLRKNVSWKNQNMSIKTHELINKFSSKKINSATGYALFWIARNSVYNLIKDNANMMLVNYESIISKPFEEFGKIFSFLEVPFKKTYVASVHSKAVNKKIDFEIDPEVSAICDDMYNRLIQETYLSVS